MSVVNTAKEYLSRELLPIHPKVEYLRNTFPCDFAQDHLILTDVCLDKTSVKDVKELTGNVMRKLIVNMLTKQLLED